MYVYVTAPQSELKYVIEIGNIVKYPGKLYCDGDGNHDFNKGKKSKYAYPIVKVYKLVCPISLEKLKKSLTLCHHKRFHMLEHLLN